MQPLLAFDDAVEHEKHVLVVEYAGSSGKVQTFVLRLVDSILPWIPFEAHRYT
jgi:hypothetical protein